ncbi:MAG: cysteine--tRNA ligase [Patescibacteria group bacterium]
MTLKLHNTLSNSLEEFKPIEQGKVKMYHCGPTVYGIQHIGNLSMFVFTDILRRTLEYSDFKAKQVINITDFGHLTSDADEGEDKMTKGLKREGLELNLENMLSMGKKYAGFFLQDLSKLNIEMEGTLFPYASDYVQDQFELIKKLEEKGLAYKTSDGLYFDTSKFPDYGKLGGLTKNNNENRVEVNSEKRNPSDFALWKSNTGLGWESPWGKGFPGWHIECSAMIIKLLGEQIDIHTGGIEHIPVHHNNEIAQSESVTGKSPFSKYWLHRAHLQIGGEKIAKSEGNVVYLSEIIEKGFSPLAFRYFLLNSTYRTPTNFTWEGLEAANNALEKLKKTVSTWQVDTEGGVVDEAYKAQFREKLENDLNTPQALAVVWTLIKDKDVLPNNKLATLKDFDKVLGLGL